MPPRRERQKTEGLEPSAEPAVVQPQEEDTVAQRLERRRAELLQKRQLESIQEIEQELAGGPRASSVAVTGEESSVASFVSHKRAASADLPHSVKRALAPPVYEGVNLRQLRDFLLGCEVYFDAIEEHNDRRRIALAASYLRKDALRQWSRTLPRPITWPAFEMTLRDMIQDPANRMSVATLKIKESRQGEGQSVREFANYIEELEEDVPEMTEEQQRAWTLLNGLRPDVRSSVLREEREIRSREQIIAAAQRLHELGRVDAGGSHVFRSRETGKNRSDSRAPAGRTNDSRSCYRCGKEGHMSRFCPQAEDKPKQ
jgi:hypothetical protein